ncbi:MAG: VOC family protein [Alphaproteobacteria bacterium]
MQKVQGIGGVFFRAKNPEALADSYRQHLGIDPVPTRYDALPWQQEAGFTVFAPFPHDTDYFPLERQWMINFRVADLDAMVAQLQAADIEVTVDDQAQPNGRVARLHDPEHNPIELWEPVG